MHVLIVDNHTLFREGIKLILSNQPTINSVDDCANTTEALARIKHSRYDLILLELNTDDTNGIDGLIQIKAQHPLVRVAVLTAEINPIVVHRSIDCGAVGFVTKRSSLQVFNSAITTIANGHVFLPTEYTNPDPADRMTNSMYRTNTTILTCLSSRQREVLTLLLQGKPNKTISSIMQISQNTVKAHMSAIFRTLGANNRTEAVYYAAKAGIRLDHNLSIQNEKPITDEEPLRYSA